MESVDSNSTPATPATPARSRIPKIELPWLILAALLLSTLLAAYQNARQLRTEAEERFSELVQSERRSILRELGHFEDLLHGASALLLAMPNLSQRTWDAFFEARMPVPENYAGLAALQYVPASSSTTGLLTHVLPARRPAQRTTGESAATVAWADIPEIAEAIILAENTHRLAISRSLGAVPGLPDLHSPIALVLKLGDGAPVPNSVAINSWPSRGYLIAIVDLHLLMQQQVQSMSTPLSLELFDGERLSYSPPPPAPALPPPEMSVDVPIEIGQRALRLRARSTPALERKLQNNTPRTILLIGILGTALLAGLIWLLTRLREQAEALAASMTKKLQEQSKFTENLLEFNPSPIFRKDTEGRFVSVNRAWEQLSGRNRDEILGKTYRDFQHADIAEQNEELDRQLLASETGYEMAEAFITNADDRQFETIIAKQALRNSDGRVEGLIGTITDVTPIKRLERELAQQREQLNLVIRSSQQGIWDVELKPGGSRYYSPRFREILGYAEGGFPREFDWEATIHPDDLAAFRGHMVRHFKGETPLFDIESRVRDKNGNDLWVLTRAIAQREVSGTKNGATPRAVRFVGSISDVTDRKRAEMKLVEANVRVTEAARAKASFLATMSHEIRTPLNGVLGMTSLLAETTLNDEQRDYIRLIRASGDTLLRLIDDVLDFSKIESGHMTLESVPVELALVVEEAFELVAEKAREKELALLFDMHENVPYYVLGDATRLRQIMLNLLANAIKFTASGEIKFTLTSRPTATGIELEGRLQDTGIGIPADRVDKLFQAFTQVDASTTRKYGGSGLGLAICRRLTQLMGGDIRVESVEGKGSVFIFTIQTQAARGPLKPYMQREVHDFVGKRLLVVDRNASRRPILVNRYSRWGFDTVAVDHAEAADALRRGPRFEVLLTDMVWTTPEATALQAALEEDDAEQTRRGAPLIASVLQSPISRAELSARGIKPLLRHSLFIVRPAGRARLFEALMRAVLNEPTRDIATRPFTPEPVYDHEFQTQLQQPSTNAGPSIPARVSEPQGDISCISPQLRGGFVLNTLVAEDNEVNQRVIRGMLNNLGHHIIVVGDGRSAVERAVVDDFDVILMDIHMPELDGVEAMREIRKQLAGKKCPPIVAMTAHALSGDREHYLGEGMDDYISKPIRSNELKALLERVNNKTMAAPWVEHDAHPAIPVSTAPLGAAVPKQNIDSVPILDIEQLEDLRYLPSAPGESNVADDPVGGLIRLFQTKALERMHRMTDLLDRREWHALSETAHSLRGASASMGFPRVAMVCKDLENTTKLLEVSHPTSVSPPNLAELESLLEQIKHYYAEADHALVAWLTSTAAPADP